MATGWKPGREARRLALLLAFAAVLALACGDSAGDATSPQAGGAAGPPRRVTFMAGFKPQANLPFVGVYVAQEKGFFREQNLEVDIRHAQSGEHLQLLLANEVQFTTANGAQVLRRNDMGFEIVSIALVGQRSEQGFAVLASSGINSVKDWEGKTFGYKGTVPAEFLAITAAAGADPSRIRQVSVGFDPRILSEGVVDILPVFFSNEPGTLERIGVRTRVFDPMDYGIQSLGLTYVATREYIAKDPDTVGRFVKAALRGIDYANQNRDEALSIVMKYAPQEEREHQRFMLATELERAQTEATRRNGIGWQTAEQWQSLRDTLLQYRGIQNAIDPAKVFTDQFVRAAYREGRLAWP